MDRTRVLLALGLALTLILPSLARAQVEEAGVEYERTVIELDIAPEWTNRTGSMIAADQDGDGARDVVVSQRSSDRRHDDR